MQGWPIRHGLLTSLRNCDSFSTFSIFLSRSFNHLPSSVLSKHQLKQISWLLYAFKEEEDHRNVQEVFNLVLLPALSTLLFSHRFGSIELRL